MSVTVDNLLFDFGLKQIQVQQARGAVLSIQDLINAIRQAEESVEGITYPKIADATGKDSLGGGVAVGVTVNLLDDWQLKWYSNGAYQAQVSGGNLVGGISDNPIAYTADVQVKVTQSANATVVTTGGSALTDSEKAQLASAEAKAKEVWQRVGLDASNPAKNKTDGGYEVGSIIVTGSTDGNGDVTQTRQ